MRCTAREISILLYLPVHRRVRERTWERGCHLEYSIYGKELGSTLLRHRMKHYLDLASSRFRIHSAFKKLRIRLPDTSDTCGRKPYLEKEADSKISG